MLKSGLWTDLKLFSITLMASKIRGEHFELDFLSYPFFFAAIFLCIFSTYQMLNITLFVIAGRNLFNHLKSALSIRRSQSFRVLKVLFMEGLVASLLILRRFATWFFNSFLSNRCFQYKTYFNALAGDYIANRAFLGYRVVCGREVEFGWSLRSQKLSCSSQLLQGFLAQAFLA